MTTKPATTIHQATPDRWDDFKRLMGPKGGTGGCWCMLWRSTAKEFASNSGEKNCRAMHKIFSANRPPGVMAFSGAKPVGWCSVAPRADFPRLRSSRILKPVDEQTVWSITCFYILSAYRRQGISVKLLKAAASLVEQHGGNILEGYPIDPPRSNYPAAFAWVGVASAFEKAGFEEVARRSATRPIMRLSL